MASDFEYDVFFCYSLIDLPLISPIAEKLQMDGLRVCDMSNVDKLDQNLLQARSLVFFVSANSLGDEWLTLESYTYRFRDPSNPLRRFIPVRLDNFPLSGFLVDHNYVDWRVGTEYEYRKLLASCVFQSADQVRQNIGIQLGHASLAIGGEKCFALDFYDDDRLVAVGLSNGVTKIWDVDGMVELQVLKQNDFAVFSAGFSPDGEYLLTSGYSNGVTVWGIKTGEIAKQLYLDIQLIECAVWNPDGRYIAVSVIGSLLVWDVNRNSTLFDIKAHSQNIWALKWSRDSEYLLSGSADSTIRLWDVKEGALRRDFRGHSEGVSVLVFNEDSTKFLSGSRDKTLRLWDVDSGKCLRVLEGHTGDIKDISWHVAGRFVLSGSWDATVRLWDIEAGSCLGKFVVTSARLLRVKWRSNEWSFIACDEEGALNVWEVSDLVVEALESSIVLSDQVQYTNAKVLLVGESSSGKTGLSRVLSGAAWEPTDSTNGAWATHWKLPTSKVDKIIREIWLWDFGGQADQRLIHQLYMNETALAILVFDGQKDNVFETLGQWDRDITRAAGHSFGKLLVVGRVDAGGLRGSKQSLSDFAKERGYQHVIETSAKTGHNCDKLKDAIIQGIKWNDIPWHSSPLLFKRLKEEIVGLKDEGKVLMRFNELRMALQFRLIERHGLSVKQFTDDELRAVISLLAGPGVVQELKFGSWVLLQPERINAYAQAVIQTIREDIEERGYIPEEAVLSGRLSYMSSINRLEGQEEQFILLAMHQTLLERGLCLRQNTDKGAMLIFPSYYRRERPELIGHPAVLISYKFSGFLDDIYATLIVRLHYTKAFVQNQLWKYAADFKTLSNHTLGVKLIRLNEGSGELQVYFHKDVPIEERIIFGKYIHEHLLQNAIEVTRFRHYVCPHCGTPVGNQHVAMKKLEEGKKDIPCISCDDEDKRVPLWDKLEELFASPKMKEDVRKLQEKSAIVLDNESKDRALVGEVISLVALAGQISRELIVSDNGIDMEIEFKTDSAVATGKKVYLQLKSGDSHLYKRKSDGKEIFNIKEKRHVKYWANQEFPVFLVVRNSAGVIRWMEIREYLKNIEPNEEVKQIPFSGEPFDIMSIRRIRDSVLGHVGST